MGATEVGPEAASHHQRTPVHPTQGSRNLWSERRGLQGSVAGRTVPDSGVKEWEACWGCSGTRLKQGTAAMDAGDGNQQHRGAQASSPPGQGSQEPRAAAGRPVAVRCSRQSCI